MAMPTVPKLVKISSGKNKQPIIKVPLHLQKRGALQYASRGIPVFPVYSARTEGVCSCPKGKNCSYIGKHPRIRDWRNQATTDSETIRYWWNTWKDTNCGIITGRISGLVVVDIDPKNGGGESLKELQTQYGLFPKTPKVQSGSGGEHYYFQYPKHLEIPSKTSLRPGIDIKSDGGSIVAPPSRHKSGKRYEWIVSLKEVPLAPLPGWLIQLIQTPDVSSRQDRPSVPIPEGERNNTLASMAGTMRRRGISAAAIEAALLEENRSRCQPPLPEDEVIGIARSIARYKTGNRLTESEVMEQMNKEYAVVLSGSKVGILREEFDSEMNRKKFILLHREDFRMLFENTTIQSRIIGQYRNGEPKSGSQADLFLKHPKRRQYKQVVFDPGGTSEENYNLWRGFAFSPNPQGDCSFYLQHLKENICRNNEEYYKYLLDYMADAVQNPKNPPGVAIVLRGGRGVGKGQAITHFAKLFGQHFVHVSNQEHLFGKFNAHLLDCLILFGDEAFWAGDKKCESTLKCLITEEYLNIERKFHDLFSVRNYIRLFLASNHEWVVPAGIDERRFLVLDVGEKRKQDTDFFRELTRQMENGGYEKLLHILQNHIYDPQSLKKAPDTDALQTQKLLSMDLPDQFWFECLKEGKIGDYPKWPEEIPKNKLTEAYMRYVKDLNRSKRGYEVQMGLFVKRLCPGAKEDTVQRGALRVRVWKLPPLDECIRQFERVTKVRVN